MNDQPFQFSIKGVLWAMLWIGIGLATIPLFNVADFLDDDGDNVVSRMLAAFWVALAVGVVESLRGRPLAWIGKTMGFWFVACVAIILMAIL